MLDKISQMIITSKIDKILVIILIVGMLLSFIISKLIDKSNNSAFKIVYIKFFLGTGFTLIVISIILDFYLKYIYNIKDNELLVTCSIFIAGLILAMHGVFLFMFGNIKPPKPDKYLLKQDNYLDFSNYLNKRMLLNDYQEVYSEENLKIYKKIIKKNKHYIIDFKTEEFTEDIYNDLYDNKMVPIMEKDLKEMQNKTYRSLYVTYIISVDRLTSYFNEFIKGLEQDIRYFSLPVGVSFGGNKIYIANEIKGFEMSQIKRMKKEIKMILELENKGNKA